MSTSDHKLKEQQEREAAIAFDKRSTELASTIKPLRKHETYSDWRYLRKTLDAFASEFGKMEMAPKFHRGPVWSTEQKQSFIENALRGALTPRDLSIQFNCPNWDSDQFKGDLEPGMQCIDGLQRLNAVFEFLDGSIRPFGFTVSDLDKSEFSIKSSNYRFHITVHTFANQSDLLKHYVNVSISGTPHDAGEIAKVLKDGNR